VVRKLTLLLLSVMLLAGCQEEDAPTPNAGATADPGEVAQADTTPATTAAPPTATALPPTPTATPLPPRDLVVCLGGEPVNLYLYGDGAPEALAVRHALYESPITSLGYAYQALALQKLPTLEDGDVRLETVPVGEGEPVITAAGQLGLLGQGTVVIDADGQPATYDGQPIAMRRLVVDYTFRPLVWSDGTPVTAEDSVFSFTVAGDRDTPSVDERVRYTAAYEATDERSVRWTGLPGFLDPAFITYVWTPLPGHQLAGFAPSEMATLEETARTPLSYGAFVVESWTPGESIRLTPNPFYDRAAEGLPHLTSLTFRFLVDGETALPTDYEGCHVLTSDLLSFDALPAVDEAAAAGALVEHVAAAGVAEQIIFGINQAGTYDETHGDWFQDARVRQAIALCTDRQALVDEFTQGRATVMDSYVSPDHSLHPDDLAQWPYDPTAGNALLDEVGLLDVDGDGVRNSLSATLPFTVTLGTNAESLQRQAINERVAEDLAECGIRAMPTTVDAGTWFAPGPTGPIFGRRFDLAAFAWLHRIQPNCDLYITGNIPGPAAEGFAGWEGINVSGWSNDAYDAACARARALLPGQPGYAEAHQEAMRLFAQELPALPLFTRLRLAATTPDVRNFRLDATQPSDLWNVFELDLALGGS